MNAIFSAKISRATWELILLTCQIGWRTGASLTTNVHNSRLQAYLLTMSQAAPTGAAPVANAGDAANESSTQKVFGVVKVSCVTRIKLLK
jgi:hypothetical protein